MTNSKHTKKALLSSVIALILCCSMLIGTTFAWFTDSVTSGKNHIVAGNLDVEVYDGNGNKIDGETDLFSGINGEDILWEPGVVAYENLTVANVGTLALKYNLGINFTNENTVNGYGLSQVLQVAVVKNGVDTSKTREEIVAGINNWQSLSSWYESGDLYAEEGRDTATYGIVIWWEPSDNDNNWNVNNGKTTSDGEPLHIDLGINLTAWQKDYESDSFNNKYDADLAVMTVAEANERMANGKDVVLIGANEPNSVVVIPAKYTGTLTLHNVSVASVQAAGDANIVINGPVVVKAKEGSAITANGELNISGTGNLTAIAADEKAAFGIGGMNTTAINIKGITIDYVSGGYDGYVADTVADQWLKRPPEGGAAIGSGYKGAVITLNNVHIVKAIGGSKAAGIGARYWTGVTVNIKDSTIDYVEGGASAAGIGGSRVSGGATSDEAVNINIVNSTITAQGGAYGAGIGSGYDTHCQSSQPLCTINIDGSTINATGGQYAAGVGTGYHNAALTGEIKDSTVNAASGEKIYKATYTSAQDVGFGVVDPAREGLQTDSKLTYNGKKITLNSAATVVESAEDLKTALSSDAEEINIVLFKDISVDIGTGWAMGGANTKSITIDGNGKTLTLSSTYRSYFNMANAEGVLNLKNMTLTNAHKGAHFFDYTTHFNCNVVAEKVTFAKSPLVNSGVKAVFTNCSFSQAGTDIYGLWIMSGSNVTVNGGELTTDRGFKIADEDSAEAKTVLKVTGTKFNNTKKAAILVTTAYGAEITLDNLDITNCTADSTNAVWIDNGLTAGKDKITVTGGSVIVEP